MKNTMKTLIASLVLAMALFISIPAQADPPGMPGNHGTNGDAPPGGGAPIGSGIVIMIAIASAYGGKKAYDLKE